MPTITGHNQTCLRSSSLLPFENGTNATLHFLCQRAAVLQLQHFGIRSCFICDYTCVGCNSLPSFWDSKPLVAVPHSTHISAFRMPRASYLPSPVPLNGVYHHRTYCIFRNYQPASYRRRTHTCGRVTRFDASSYHVLVTIPTRRFVYQNLEDASTNECVGPTTSGVRNSIH